MRNRRWIAPVEAENFFCLVYVYFLLFFMCLFFLYSFFYTYFGSNTNLILFTIFSDTIRQGADEYNPKTIRNILVVITILFYNDSTIDYKNYLIYLFNTNLF